MMTCQRCNGIVYWDRLYDNETYIDLACLGCGKRWFVKRDNILARILIRARPDDNVPLPAKNCCVYCDRRMTASA